MIARARRRAGMTLIEVMIALVILTGALLGMGKFIT
jgi:prepilin-type N-terminal cleavage/methylation domain-containing protein